MTGAIPDSDGSPSSTNLILENLWGRMRTELNPKVPISTLWKPYSAELYPASDILADEYGDPVAATAHFPAGYLGHNMAQGVFNLDGCVLVPVTPGQPNDGFRNNPTTRNSTGSVHDFEFMLNDDAVSFMFQANDQYDCQVYVSDENDVMHKVRSRPLVYTGSPTFIFRTIKFATRRTRRIRFVGAQGVFYQVLTSTSAVIRQSPKRELVVSVSDSFREGSGMKNTGSAESYHTAAISDWYIERTGWSMARLGQGGTGWFNNATGNASNEGGPDNSRPFFSDANVEKIKAFGKNRIRIIEVNGTINDGVISGGKAGMKARANEGLNKISSWDPGIRFILWGPEPYNDSAVPGSDNDLNRQGLKELAEERSDIIGFIDAGNPDAPFYTGTGSEKTPNAQSQQAILTGFDEIHYNYLGGQHYASMGLAIMKDFYIESEREIVE